jgi:hypothetical protein
LMFSLMFSQSLFTYYTLLKWRAAKLLNKGLHKRLEMVEAQGSVWCLP